MKYSALNNTTVKSSKVKQNIMKYSTVKQISMKYVTRNTLLEIHNGEEKIVYDNIVLYLGTLKLITEQWSVVLHCGG